MPDRPNRLHKYRSVKQTVELLRTNHLWWSCPQAFADHEDCQWNPYSPILDEQFRARHYFDARVMLADESCWGSVSPELARRLAWLKTLSPALRHEWERHIASEYSKSFPEDVEKSLGRDRDIIARLRVLCLCADPNSSRMWREYADGGAGCMISFDTSALNKVWPHERLLEVRYVSALPSLIDAERWSKSVLRLAPSLTESEHETIAREWVRTKLDKWSHEREWRFVHLLPRGANSEPLHPPFLSEALVEITLGHGCSSEDRVAIETVCPADVVIRRRE
jgi:hypothetical protein